MKSAIAPMPMAIIALVMTKAHRADKNTKRQPMIVSDGLRRAGILHWNDPVTDFTPISMIATVPSLLVGNPAGPCYATGPGPIATEATAVQPSA